MLKIIYGDTNLFYDWVDWRKGGVFGQHNGEAAQNLIVRLREGEYCLAISSHLLWQLEKHPKYAQCKELFDLLKKEGRLIRVESTAEDKAKASDLCSTNNTEFEDALHFVMAKKAGATTIVTQNERHYACFRSMIKVSPPQMIDVLG